MKKEKPTILVKDYYELLEKTKKDTLRVIFPKNYKSYEHLIVACNGAVAAFNFAQEQLRKLFDLPDYEN